MSLLFISFSTHADTLCAGFIQSDASSGLIAYLDVLLDTHELTVGDLRAMHDGLREGRIVNPLSARKNISARIHRQALEEYLRSGRTTVAEVLRWTTRKLGELEQNQDERDASATQTIRADYPMVFHRVEANHSSPYIIERPILVMETLVTQAMWSEIMPENPSFLTDASQRNHPVENITWLQAAEFANRLSVRDGLDPVYDLRAAPSATIRDTDGYRMPSTREADYLTDLAVQKSVNRKTDFIWYGANSGGTTQSVAELQAVVLNEQPFFDLLGNVAIFADVDDASELCRELQSPICLMIGTSYRSRSLKDTNVIPRTHHYYHTGLRLVRSLR